MITYLFNFIILFIYLLFFWVIIRSSGKAKIILFSVGFGAAAFAGLSVDFLYKLPYFNIRSFAYIVEELCKFVFVLLFFNWKELMDLLLKDKKSIVWFGVIVGLYFAFLENFSWIQTHNIGLDVVIKRAFIGWPMHMICTFLSVYGLIQVFILKKKVYWLLLLPASILIHFLFNCFIAPAIP